MLILRTGRWQWRFVIVTNLPRDYVLLRESIRLVRPDDEIGPTFGIYIAGCLTLTCDLQVKRFVVDSWADYLRHRRRATVADEEAECTIASMLIIGETPKMQHFIATAIRPEMEREFTNGAHPNTALLKIVRGRKTPAAR
jgi:Transmembrane secretion effector